MLLTAGCTLPEKKTDWTVTLQKKDKRPYGGYLAFESVHHYFPQARTEAVNRDFRFSNIDKGMAYHYDSASLLVLTGLDFLLSEHEMTYLLSFAAKGNEIFIISSNLDYKIKDTLQCAGKSSGMEEELIQNFNPGIKNVTALQLQSDPVKRYGMSGRSLLAWYNIKDTAATAADHEATDVTDSTETGNDTDSTVFSEADTAAYTVQALDSVAVEKLDYEEKYGHTTGIDPHPEVLGNAPDGPDFIRYTVGKGHITLHAAPLAFSNYFLLQRNNREYLDGVWRTFPRNISHIYWDDYYKRRIRKAGLGLLFQYPGTRWAFIIVLLLLLLYVLFESKRRQRIIPVLPKTENSSVSFAETVGRLYYNKGNHTNLAEKIIQQFLERVRTHYYLNTGNFDENFIRQLSSKSGIHESVVREFVTMAEEIKNKQVSVDEAYLYHLHETIQQFYKTT
ncbi:DUF4350 domain-containing protein [Chitinophagaceae bacterium MMS25-I14]